VRGGRGEGRGERGVEGGGWRVEGGYGKLKIECCYLHDFELAVLLKLSFFINFETV
jgi:hypothetical protein